MQVGAEQILYQTTSAHQEIVLTRDSSGSVNLTLDRYWQFASRDEHVFHETLVDPAMVLAPTLANVLVLGGGDGLALRNALRYPTVTRAVLCEIDACVVEMAREVPEMIELNADSLRDPRVEVVIGDAHDFVRQTTEAFDVVICDFPAPWSELLSRLFEPEFFAQLLRVSGTDAVISTQVSTEPQQFWSVLEAISPAFPWIQPRLVDMGDPDRGDDWANFVLASAVPRQPARELAAGVRFVRREILERLVIQNRGGDHFETAEYGDQPDFSGG